MVLYILGGFVDPVNLWGDSVISPNFRTYNFCGQSFLAYADAVEKYGAGEVFRGKIDFYASVRETYFQKRHIGEESVYESPKILMED